MLEIRSDREVHVKIHHIGMRALSVEVFLQKRRAHCALPAPFAGAAFSALRGSASSEGSARIGEAIAGIRSSGLEEEIDALGAVVQIFDSDKLEYVIHIVLIEGNEAGRPICFRRLRQTTLQTSAMPEPTRAPGRIR